MVQTVTEKISDDSEPVKFRISTYTWLAWGLHLLIALPLAWKLNIWLDEGWTLQATSGGVFQAWHDALAVERQAPLYFAIAAAMQKFGEPLFALRLFSIFCSLATIALIAPLVRRFASGDFKTLEKLLPLVVALHPYLIWASVEARVYALIVALTAGLLLFWFDGYAANAPDRRACRLIYIVLAVVGLYTNYYLGFVLVAGAVALIVLRRWKSLFGYVWQMIVVGAFFLPLALVVKTQMQTNSDYFFQKPEIADVFRFVLTTASVYLLPSAESEPVSILRVWMFRLAVLALLFLAIKSFRRIEKQIFALGALTAVIILFLIAVFFLLGSEYIQLRHCAPLFVPLVLLAGVVINRLTGKIGVYIWITLLVFFAPTRLASTYIPLAKNGNWNEVSRFIETRELENQPITLFETQDSIPFKYVYRGKNTILPADDIGDWRPQGARQTAERYRGQIAALISQISAGQEQVWLITNAYCEEKDTRAECQPLEEYVEANFMAETDERLFSRRVRLLRRK